MVGRPPHVDRKLLSYEAERRMVAESGLTENTADARRAVSSRLDFVIRDDRPASMSAFALFWPHPALAELGDPLLLVDDGAPLDVRAAEARVDEEIRRRAHQSDVDGSRPTWEAFFGWPGSWPSGAPRRSDVAAYWLAGNVVTPEGADVEAGLALRRHARCALELPGAAHWDQDLARLAMHSPGGNIAYRALARICDSADQDMRTALWQNAARLANAIRTLFNRMDVMFLLDQLYGKGQPYWKSVLQYCADGNLQAVLDEYCFQLKLEFAGSTVDASVLSQLTDRAVEALTLRTSHYSARAAGAAFEKIPITVRFALRYGGAVRDAESVRAPRCAMPSTARFGHSSSHRPASGRKASTSIGGAIPLCIGICRSIRSTSSSARAGSIGSAATPCARTWPRLTGVTPWLLRSQVKTRGSVLFLTRRWTIPNSANSHRGGSIPERRKSSDCWCTSRSAATKRSTPACVTRSRCID